MNFTQTYEAVALTVASGAVPLIIGESGIGKTALIRSFSQDMGLFLVTVDANLLKEGEIGGLPTVTAGKTFYATHHKLAQIEEYLEAHENGCLLFIDEINRCDHAVQQELMNLILNREINGYQLSPRVVVAAAMNPPPRMDSLGETRYQVVEMDPAQENRFVWLPMDSDPKEWIVWGMGEGAIHPQVLEFIGMFPESLHEVSKEEGRYATPRSWERISRALWTLEDSAFKEEALYHFVRGNVGPARAQDFLGFRADQKNALPSAQEVLGEEQISQWTKDALAQASHSRRWIFVMNLFRAAQEKPTPQTLQRVAQVLLLMPKDLRLSLMRDLRRSFYEDLYPALLAQELFLEAFYESFR
ncbi:MoxR-like ATPase [Clostridiaceae bacterium JG1575]|nr:MoxR-like ATPase [Clostridiaceae bacterium JG1575]